MSRKGFEDGYDVVKFLAESENRLKVFESVSQGTQNWDKIDVIQSTVSSNLGDLENAGLIREIDTRDYELTPFGEIISESYLSLLEDSKSIVRLFPLLPFFNQIPDYESHLCDLELLADAELYKELPSGRNPARDKYMELISNATKIDEIIHRSIIPTTVLEHLRNGDLERTNVHSPKNLIEEAREDERWHNRWKKLHEHGAHHYAVDESITTLYTLSIYDDETVSIIPSSTDQDLVLLVTQNPEVLDWAKNRIQTAQKKSGEMKP